MSDRATRRAGILLRQRLRQERAAGIELDRLRLRQEALRRRAEAIEELLAGQHASAGRRLLVGRPARRSRPGEGGQTAAPYRQGVPDLWLEMARGGSAAAALDGDVRRRRAELAAARARRRAAQMLLGWLQARRDAAGRRAETALLDELHAWRRACGEPPSGPGLSVEDSPAAAASEAGDGETDLGDLSRADLAEA